MLSIEECWLFLESSITSAGLGDVTLLPPGVNEPALEIAEATIGAEFPRDLRQFLLRHDGSARFFLTPYKIGGGGQRFLSLDEIQGIWKDMADIVASFERGGEFGSQTGPIKPNYWNSRWVPLTDNECGDNIFVDLDPGENGKSGQIVDWWHEGGVSTFLSPSLREWLNEVVCEIGEGLYQFRQG